MDTSFCVCLSNESYHHHLAAQHAELAPISSSEPAVSLPSTVVLDQVQVAVLCVVDFQQADSPARRFDDGVEGPVLLHQIPMVLKKTLALPVGRPEKKRQTLLSKRSVVRRNQEHIPSLLIEDAVDRWKWQHAEDTVSAHNFHPQRGPT
jgi:hypothetical protein